MISSLNEGAGVTCSPGGTKVGRFSLSSSRFYSCIPCIPWLMTCLSPSSKLTANYLQISVSLVNHLLLFWWSNLLQPPYLQGQSFVFMYHLRNPEESLFLNIVNSITSAMPLFAMQSYISRFYGLGLGILLGPLSSLPNAAHRAVHQSWKLHSQ